MINMSDMQFETINLHHLVQPDDLAGDRFRIAEEQCALSRDQLFDRRVAHRCPAALAADLGKRLAVGRQKLFPGRTLIAEDVTVAVYRQRRSGVMLSVLQSLAVKLDQRCKG